MDARAEFLQGGFVGLAVNFDKIGFGDVRGGIGELLGEGAVVGEKEKAFGGVVEAADGIDARGEVTEKLQDGGAAFGVAGGGDVAFRLVEHEIDGRLGGVDGFAVNGDGVGGEVGFGAEFGDDFAVDGDAAGEDEFFGFAARGDAGGGEEFLKAFGHGRRGLVAGSW